MLVLVVARVAVGVAARLMSGMADENVRPDIPDDVLGLAWTPQVRKQYHIDAKSFYATRDARGVCSMVRPGPRCAVHRPGVDRKRLHEAVADGRLGHSTAEKYKKLKRKRDTEGHTAGRLAVIWVSR